MRHFKPISSVVYLEFLKKFSGDIYIIALPAIAASLETSKHHVQILLTCFLIGVVIAQIFAGPLSDKLGRRTLLITLLPIFIIGSGLCALIHQMYALYCGVCLMGLGIGSAPAISKALIHDIYKKPNKTAKILVVASFFVVWAPAISMAIGGHLTSLFGWPTVFELSCALGIIGFICAWLFLSNSKPASLSFNPISVTIAQYKHLLSYSTFAILVIAVGLLASGVIAYYSASLFIYHHTLNLPIHWIGYLAFFIVGSNLLGKIIGVNLHNHLATTTTLTVSAAIATTGAILMLGLSLMHKPHLLFILLPMIIYMIGLGSIMPVIRAHLMNFNNKLAGSASSLTGLTITIFCCLSSFIVSRFHVQTCTPLAILLTILAICCLLLIITTRRLAFHKS